MSQTPGNYQELTTISLVTDVWKLTTCDRGNRRERADTVISYEVHDNEHNPSN